MSVSPSIMARTMRRQRADELRRIHTAPRWTPGTRGVACAWCALTAELAYAVQREQEPTDEFTYEDPRGLLAHLLWDHTTKVRTAWVALGIFDPEHTDPERMAPWDLTGPQLENVLATIGGAVTR